MPQYDNSCADECSNKCKGKGCCLPCCAPNPCQDKYSASEICCKFRAAVVTISSQWCTTARVQTPPPVPPVVGEISFMRVQGSGAFVDICKRRYILTSSALVQIPPSILAVNNRYPLSGVENVSLDQSPTDIVAASRILITVRDLNGRAKPAKKCEDGHTFVYEASPAFVDGAGGWALLYVDMCKEWNRCLPHIEECHPCFQFGKSRKLNCGDPLYLLGDWGSGATPDHYNSTGTGITEGVVAKHRAADHSGWAPAELIWAAFEAYHSTLGCPMVNQFGQLVGVQYASVPGQVDVFIPPVSFPVNGSGAVAGISTFFIEYGLKCFSVLGSRKRKYDCYRRHLASVLDIYHGDYYKYLKGFIGISYQLVEASDYNTRLGSGVTGSRVPLLQDAVSGGLYEGPAQKNLAGIRVENIAGYPAGASTIPALGDAMDYIRVAGALVGGPAPYNGTTPFNGLLLNSPFLASLAPETIITAGEECYFGDESKQIAPGLLTWKYIGGDLANFVVRRPAFESATSLIPTSLHLRDSNSVTGKLLSFPSDYDYPWACINSISLPLSVQVAPVTGLLFPPVMAVAGFKSAI